VILEGRYFYIFLLLLRLLPLAILSKKCHFSVCIWKSEFEKHEYKRDRLKVNDSFDSCETPVRRRTGGEQLETLDTIRDSISYGL
jgi:hypothetical protein